MRDVIGRAPPGLHWAPGGPICTTAGRALLAAGVVARRLKCSALRRHSLLSDGPAVAREGVELALLAQERGKHPIYVFVYQCKRSRAQRRKGEFYPFSRHGWRKDWQRALEAAGIEDFRFHDLRHTAATRVLRATGNIKAVQKMLGHSDITTTARYAHVLMDDVRAAMEAAERHTIPTPALPKAANNLK